MVCHGNEKIDERFVVVIAAALLVLEVGSGAVSVILCVGYVEWTSLFSCRDAPVRCCWTCC